MKRKFYVVLFVFISLSGIAQDNHYSQFYANKLYLNPAFAGTDVCPRIILGYRDQWPGLSGEYVSYTASYDQSFNSMGVGLLFNADDAGRGVLKTNNIGFVLSPKVQLDQNWTLSVAIEAGITQGWEKYTGNCTLSTLNIGINRFGESAPGKEVADYFGLNVETIKEKIIKAFKR